ncbi:GNAT family N-acetyltransferase [Bradyrhizobium sp. 2TAF24]|uniref:GNAT family N-acetyltransferase n=1 Tax=Bradyrhizobium sp. 2TAF24 TaxID=3233011 RepID=UPI003F91B318
MSIDLRVAADADRPFLIRLEDLCMRGYATALWGRYTPSFEATSPLAGHRIVVAAGREAGCLATEDRGDHLWVAKLYIHPDYQRRGIGAIVLHHAVAEAQARDWPLRLSVLVTNPAQAFYRREGLRAYEHTPERVFMTTEPAGPRA